MIKIKSAFHTIDTGYPILELHLQDNRIAYITTERRRLNTDGLVFLGWDFEDDSEFAKKFKNGDTGKGFTNDPEVVKLFRQFLTESDGKNYRERKVI